MEQWDIFDSKGHLTGKTVSRGNVYLSKGEYHLVVHVWVIGSDGRVLIQRRSEKKPLMPGEWAATGGAVVAGEDSITAARRELNEELGITVTEYETLFVERIKRKNSFLDIYLVKKDIPVSKMLLQKDEVAEVRWVHQNKLRHMIKTGKYHNYGKHYFNVVFSAFKKVYSKEKYKNK